jgi:hypothetical protein
MELAELLRPAQGRYGQDFNFRVFGGCHNSEIYSGTKLIYYCYFRLPGKGLILLYRIFSKIKKGCPELFTHDSLSII